MVRWHDIPDPENPGALIGLLSVRPAGIAIHPRKDLIDWFRDDLQLQQHSEHRRLQFFVPLGMVDSVLDKLGSGARRVVYRERPLLEGWREREWKLYEERHANRMILAELSGALAVSNEIPILARQAWLEKRCAYDRLYPFQRASLIWMDLAFGRGINGDDMGLGKTPQTLCYMESHDTVQRALIVCPSSVSYNWQKEGASWAPSFDFRVATSARQLARDLERGPPDHRIAWIVTWGLLYRCFDTLERFGFDSIVGDEAHNIKSLHAQRSQAFLGLAFQARHRMLLTGTSVRNRPAEFWPLLHCISPLQYRHFRPFGELFCGPKTIYKRGAPLRTYKGKSRLPRLNLKTRPFMSRRTKKEALPQLPPKIIQSVPVPWPTKKLERESRAMMAELRAKMLAAREQGDGGEQDATVLALLHRARMHAALAKVPSTLDWIESTVQQDEPVVVFLYHDAVREALEEGLGKLTIPYAVIVGSTPKKRRERIKERFQAGELQVLLGSEAMKEGVTLTRGRYTYHAEGWFVPADEDQADDRCYRIGQERKVFCVYPYLPGSIDEHLAAIRKRKRAITGAIMDRTPVHAELLARILDEAT